MLDGCELIGWLGCLFGAGGGLECLFSLFFIRNWAFLEYCFCLLTVRGYGFGEKPPRWWFRSAFFRMFGRNLDFVTKKFFFGIAFVDCWFRVRKNLRNCLISFIGLNGELTFLKYFCFVFCFFKKK